MGDKEENKSDISDDLREEFEKTGKIHIEKEASSMNFRSFGPLKLMKIGI